MQIDLPSAQEISKAPKKRSRETEREIEELGCEIPVFSLIKDEKMIISRTDVLEVQDEG